MISKTIYCVLIFAILYNLYQYYNKLDNDKILFKKIMNFNEKYASFSRFIEIWPKHPSELPSLTMEEVMAFSGGLEVLYSDISEAENMRKEIIEHIKNGNAEQKSMIKQFEELELSEYLDSLIMIQEEVFSYITKRIEEDSMKEIHLNIDSFEK